MPEEPRITPNNPQQNPVPPEPQNRGTNQQPPPAQPQSQPQQRPTPPPPPNIPVAPAQQPSPPPPAATPIPSPSPPIPPQRPSQPKQQRFERQQPPPFQPEQKKTILDRTEIQTMQKDIRGAREQEAQQEQQRIAQLKTQKTRAQDQETIEQIRAAAQQQQAKEQQLRQQRRQKLYASIAPAGEEQPFHNIPQKPSSQQKVFVRIAFILVLAFILVNIGLFLYWFLFTKNSTYTPEQRTTQQPTPTQPTPPLDSDETQPPDTPDTTIPDEPPSPILNVSRAAELTFSNENELITILSQAIQAPTHTSSITRVTIQNTATQQHMSQAQELFSLLEAPVPEHVIPILSAPTDFFLYTYQRKNRFGMVTQIDDPIFTINTLTNWEPTLEASIAPLQPFWGSPGQGYTASFRSSSYKGIEMRLQTFSTQDYGIVYAVINDHLILSSSYEATKALIDELQTPTTTSQSSQTIAYAYSPQNPPTTLSSTQSLGQILMIGFHGSTLTPKLEALMKRLQPGGVLLLGHNIKSPVQLRQLTQDLQRVSLEYSGLPLFIAVDQEGGDISRIEFGQEVTAQSDLQDTQHAYAVGQERGQELVSLGINLNLSPVLDEAYPNDFLFSRTFQTNQVHSSQLATSLLKGQQRAGILSTVKHFPGYGNISFNPEKSLATVPDLPDISSFLFAVSANPKFLMLSNVIYNDFDPGIPFTFSEKGIELIRKDLGFTGIVLSDDLSQPSLLENYGLQDITARPLQAGVTMLMFSKQSYAQDAHALLLEQMHNNVQLQNHVQTAAQYILETKQEYFYNEHTIPPLDHFSQNR